MNEGSGEERSEKREGNVEEKQKFGKSPVRKRERKSTVKDLLPKFW